MAAHNATTTTPVSVGARRRLKLLLLVVALFMSWAAYTLIVQQHHTGERASQMRAAKDKLTQVQQKNAQLQKEIERLNDDEYIGQIARQQGMGLPGEQSIHMEKPSP
ncbi:FtsB family cell division protein [Cohnella nanjingensis]|uniref:Septum formation initiator family protein n=1 Tax=Cohnella nanjingensis TaxID=1387779 RepID=A0A7X0RLA7_9BACL|nr:septum formation initiator family protein [Cohnella nanjingensis]MBB6669572.1 septum formation initiator family protein [Cohnella nanjingensis]